MQTYLFIVILRRIAAARGELLQHPLELDGEVIMCRDEQQAALLRHLYSTWTAGTSDSPPGGSMNATIGKAS